MVKRRIIWSLRAKTDMFKILDFYFKRNGTKDYSLKLSSNIRKAIKLLEIYPEIGVRTDFENTRILIHGNYEIFYETNPKTVEIITIWDSRQNPRNLKVKLKS